MESEMIDISIQNRFAVYFNLHKKMFSVKAVDGPQRGRVVSHTNHICLTDVRFKVSERGRQRVLKEKRKNVHAFVEGEITDEQNIPLSLVRYNPYVMATFQRTDDDTPVYFSRYVEMRVINDQPFVWIPT